MMVGWWWSGTGTDGTEGLVDGKIQSTELTELGASQIGILTSGVSGLDRKSVV